MKFYLVILFSFLYTNFSWCQKRNIPLHTFKSYLHQESLGIDSSNKVVSIPTMEDEELPILFRKIGLNKKILELSFITCWMKNPDCWPVKDLTIFCARKTQTGILFDKITLFALTPLNGDSVLFFLQKPSSNFL